MRMPFPRFRWRPAAEPFRINGTPRSACSLGKVCIACMETVSMKKHPVLSLAAVLAVTAFSGSAAIMDGLVGHWTFNETSADTVADSSGNNNHGTVSNLTGDAPLWVEGKIGGALEFRGPDVADSVYVPYFERGESAFSVSAWVLADPRDGTWPESVIIENGLGLGGPFGLVIRSKNRDQAFGPLGNTSSDGNGPVVVNETVGFPTGIWQHVGVVADGATIKLYRNGVEMASADYSPPLASPAGMPLGIGAMLDESGSALGSYWLGRIDDIGLWTNALTAAQMASIYNAGQAGQDLAKADQFQNAPPTISAQPQSQSRFVGETVSFSVTAAGSSLAYQWKRNGQDLPQATNATYTIASVQSTDAGTYTVTITNPGGSVTSTEATLTVQGGSLVAGLSGHWTFDETQGTTAADSSGLNNPGILVNFPEDNTQWVTGQVGRALQFGGPDTQQYVRVANIPKPTTTLTVALWAWAESRPTWASLVKNWGDSQAGQFHFGLFAGEGQQNIYIKQADGKTPNVSDSVEFPLGSWQHVAFVCDGSNLILYRNGVAVATTPYDGTLITAQMESVGIGVKLNNEGTEADTGNPGYWHGKMDDLGIWTRGLSPGEILAIYNAGLSGKNLTEAVQNPIANALAGYWRFDETQGEEAADSSPGKNNAALINYPGDNSQWIEGKVGGALQFGGPDLQQYAIVSEYPKPTTSFTASLWAWADSRPTWASWVKNWGGGEAGQFHFGLFAGDGTENIYIKQTDGKTPNVSDPDEFPLESWHHVAFVCDGSKVRLYRDGVEVASTDYDGTFVVPPMNAMGIGAKLNDAGTEADSGAAGYWHGRMDEVAIWTRGLSASEIQAIYTAGQNGKGILEAAPSGDEVALTAAVSGSNLSLSWPSSAADFTLEVTDVLPATSWNPVQGVQGNTISITIGPGRAFYRLRK